MAVRERYFVGLYSGASADGVDAAVVKIRYARERMKVAEVCSTHLPFPQGLRRRIVAMVSARAEPAGTLAELDRDVGEVFADAARRAIVRADVPPADIAAVGSSGHLVRRCLRSRGHDIGAQVTAGWAPLIAARTGRPVVSGFSDSDVACGGWGGSVTAWPNWLLLRDKRLSRVAVHLGGIVGLALVGGGAGPQDVVAFDVGPGTILIDELARKHFNRPFDADGTIASQAAVNAALLHELLANGYFQTAPPKSTCPSQWGEAYMWRVINMAAKHNCRAAELLSTVTEMTARLVALAVGKLTERPHEVILSGGGAMNIHLAGRIRKLLSPCSTYACERYGLALRAKEAVCYAVLAAARLDGYAAHCPVATGAERRTVLGGVWMPWGLTSSK